MHQTIKRTLGTVALAALFCAAPAGAEEVAPGVLRTPETRFADLEDFPYAPNYHQVGDIRLHYVDEGPPDGEPLLLIHGEPTWSYLFRKMIPVFVEAGYRVVAPDLVGFGRSDKFTDEDAYSYPMQVDHMLELVRALDLTNATFFGQDWGGLIGLRVVAAEPDRFARVVVSNTALPSASGLQGWIAYPLFKLAVWWEGEMTLEELAADLTFPRWVAYSYHVPDLPIGRIMGFLGGNPGTVAAYEAPFPDQRYKPPRRSCRISCPRNCARTRRRGECSSAGTSPSWSRSRIRTRSPGAANRCSSPACPTRTTSRSGARATSCRRTPGPRSRGSWSPSWRGRTCRGRWTRTVPFRRGKGLGEMLDASTACYACTDVGFQLEQ